MDNERVEEGGTHPPYSFSSSANLTRYCRDEGGGRSYNLRQRHGITEKLGNIASITSLKEQYRFKAARVIIGRVLKTNESQMLVEEITHSPVLHISLSTESGDSNLHSFTKES
jgi:hypothetical protein